MKCLLVILIVISLSASTPPIIDDSSLSHSSPSNNISSSIRIKRSYEEKEKKKIDDCIISVAIPENEKENTPITNVSISRIEKVVPLSIWPLTVDMNGSIWISNGLDYEKEDEHNITISIIDNENMTSRSCLINIIVLDRYEGIIFINYPRPFISVVPIHPPIGLHIYKFEARNEGRNNSNNDYKIQYNLINQEPQGYFALDKNNGIVRTLKRNYPRGKTFRLFVEAKEVINEQNESSNNHNMNVAVLEIVSQDRPPQFIKELYEVEVFEDTLIDTSLVDIKAISFRSIEGKVKDKIHYSIKDSPWRRFFHIDSSTGIIYLKDKLDYDDKIENRIHKLHVIADEGGLYSISEVNVYVKDVNDNSPIFKQPLYSTYVREDYPIGKTILKVEAIDKDSGENGRISYSMNDNHNFTINQYGEISAKIKLDADQLNEGTYIYRLIINGIDNGFPRRSSSTNVSIRIENCNDESPLFIPTSLYTAYVAEDAQSGSPIIQIQAIDPDGDDIVYSLINENGDESLSNGMIRIDKDTGLIRLEEGINGMKIQEVSSPFNVTIVAKDDGSCCIKGRNEDMISHKTIAILRIGIEDINNNKPVFNECSLYSKRAKLKEGSYKNNKVEIIKVHAEDGDNNYNGQILYSIYHSVNENRKAFMIDPHTGILYPSPHVVFDREIRSKEEVTVKASDNGDRPLIAFCHFSVQIEDVNDNAPIFDRESYYGSVSRHASPGTIIVTIFAIDHDEPKNAHITYTLDVDPVAGDEHVNDIYYVKLSSESNGEIILNKEIPPYIKMNELRFIVTANDNGEDGSLTSTATVSIVVNENTVLEPQWKSSDQCLSRVTVRENSEMNSILVRCLATTHSSSSLIYKLIVSSAVVDDKADNKFRHFTRIHKGEEWIEVSMMESLDYETSHNYSLTLIATDMTSYVSSSRTLIVIVEDENDSVPQFTVDLFTGTINEEMTPDQFYKENNGEGIVRVEAIDIDSKGPSSEVFYRIVHLNDDDDGLFFRIDESSGDIFPIEKLDREHKDEYIITVEGRDNAKSSLPGVHSYNIDTTKVRIVVGDVNDNPPYFDESLYEGKVREDVQIGHVILTLKANDKDKNSKLRYEISNVDKDKRLLFGMETESGIVFVREPLDYEDTPIHYLVVTVLDGILNATTQLIIYVEDVNDCVPQFNQSLYQIRINEEDGDIPKVVLQVGVTDRDSNETNGQIVYHLEGQGVGDHFIIDRYTGEIEVITSLDRDPPNGLPIWKFVVHASDRNGNEEGLIGYADVEIHLTDMNDNAPIFPNGLYGFIDENREPQSSEGIFIMRVEANDLDDPSTLNAQLTYSIRKNKEINGIPVFYIDPSNGKIFSMMALDREGGGDNQMVITVVANDNGIPQREGQCNVTIFIRDKNDNAPYFEQKEYRGDVYENAPIDSAVLTLSAIDIDNDDPDNILVYNMEEDNKYFYITSESDGSGSSIGVIRVKEVHYNIY